MLLYCLPHAGGSAAVFAGWRSAFADDVEVVPVELPGRGSRRNEKPVDDIQQLACQMWDEHGVPDRPAGFLGHSMGALVAYHMAFRAEQQQAAPVCHLFAVASPAPSVAAARRRIADLPDAGFVAELVRSGLLPPDAAADQSLMAAALSAIRADHRACEHYPGSTGRIEAPITVVAGQYDRSIPADDLAAWARHSAAGSRTYWLPATHDVVSEASTLLIRLVRAALAQRAPRRLTGRE